MLLWDEVVPSASRFFGSRNRLMIGISKNGTILAETASVRATGKIKRWLRYDQITPTTLLHSWKEHQFWDFSGILCRAHAKSRCCATRKSTRFTLWRYAATADLVIALCLRAVMRMESYASWRTTVIRPFQSSSGTIFKTIWDIGMKFAEAEGAGLATAKKKDS